MNLRQLLLIATLISSFRTLAENQKPLMADSAATGLELTIEADGPSFFQPKTEADVNAMAAVDADVESAAELKPTK